MMLKEEDLLYSERFRRGGGGKYCYIVYHPGEDVLWGMIHYMTSETNTKQSRESNQLFQFVLEYGSTYCYRD